MRVTAHQICIAALCVVAAWWLATASGCSDTPVAAPRPTVPADIRLIDLSGNEVTPLRDVDADAVVFVFVRTDCPISNRYAPDLRMLAAKHEARGARFWLVYPDPAVTPDAIARHLREYELDLDALRDPTHILVRLCGATVTPEAAVYRPDGELVYRGRIDDRHVDFGRSRPEATTHDLDHALDELLDGHPVSNPRTRAIGCYIGEL